MDKEDPKDKTKRRNKARTVSENKKEEVPEDEESDTGSDSVPFIISRVKWFPFGYTDSDEDSEDELEASNDTDGFFVDSEFETEDDSSEEESGYFTPPNTPEMEEEIPQLTEDERSDNESDDKPDMPVLLSDSEDEDDIPVGHLRTDPLNSLITRPTPVDEGPTPPGCPGIWTEYEDEDPRDEEAYEAGDL